MGRARARAPCKNKYMWPRVTPRPSRLSLGKAGPWVRSEPQTDTDIHVHVRWGTQVLQLHSLDALLLQILLLILAHRRVVVVELFLGIPREVVKKSSQLLPCLRVYVGHR